jgi:hypothetical protein
MKFLILAICFNIISCNKINANKSNLSFYKIEEKSFDRYINKKNMREGVNLQADKHMLNRDYPIEIFLYNNGEWYYNLDNLGDGHGTWKYESGKLKLHAKRTLFDMHIEIESIKEDGSEIVVKFSDRFGPNTLEVEKLNFNK